MIPQKSHDEHAISRYSVAVIIPCHNYGRYLGEAIESILHQTVAPCDILVVDDASDDNTAAVAKSYASRGVRLLQVRYKSLSLTRNAGARETRSAFLLFLDADDRLPADYIEQSIRTMGPRSIAFAYCNRQEFGAANRLIIAPAFSRHQLSLENYISSNALIRRQVFDLVGGYRFIPGSLEDWDFYRRIIAMGFTAVHAGTCMEYRVHEKSMLHTLQKDPLYSYARLAALAEFPVTIFTAFAGRMPVFRKYIDALLSLECNREMIHLHWYNTSPDPAFDTLLRSTLPDMPFGSITYTHAPLPENWRLTPDTLIQGRIGYTDIDYYYQLAVVRAYNYLIQTCTTEYALTLEDDIALAPKTLEQLQQAMGPDIAATIAPYRSGFYPRYELWKKSQSGLLETYKVRGSGMEEVGGSGFGCTLFRMSMLRAIAPLRTAVLEHPKEWYDQISYKNLAQQGHILCNWNAEVEHMTTERYKEKLKPEFL